MQKGTLNLLTYFPCIIGLQHKLYSQGHGKQSEAFEAFDYLKRSINSYIIANDGIGQLEIDIPPELLDNVRMINTMCQTHLQNDLPLYTEWSGGDLA